MSDPVEMALPPQLHPLAERRHSGRFHRRLTRTGGSSSRVAVPQSTVRAEIAARTGQLLAHARAVGQTAMPPSP